MKFPFIKFIFLIQIFHTYKQIPSHSHSYVNEYNEIKFKGNNFLNALMWETLTKSFFRANRNTPYLSAISRITFFLSNGMLACSAWNKEIIEFAKENLNVHKRPHFSKYVHTRSRESYYSGSTSLHISPPSSR